MKKSIIWSILILSITAGSITSCKKYEDGPRFSLRSKKARIANTWKIEKQYKNGVEQSLSSFDLSQRFTFEKDGSAYNSNTLGTSTGTWDLISDKEVLQTTLNYTGFIQVTTIIQYTILRLKEKELWVKYTDSSGDEIEVHLVEL